jgi:hypothetical protein
MQMTATPSMAPLGYPAQIHAVRLSPVHPGVSIAAHQYCAGRINIGPQPERGHGAMRQGVELDTAQFIAAAKDFSVNSDFDISAALASSLSTRRQTSGADLKDLFDIMKAESAGKRTIQALADKIVLSGIVENMEIPQMPMFLAAREHVTHQQIAEMLETAFVQNGEDEVCVKPTHLSNGMGVMNIQRPTPEQWGATIEFLFEHMNHWVTQRPDAKESVAMQSLKPGYIAQPRYKSSVQFDKPLEVRVIAMWGKARMGIWWWGKEKDTQRNTWIMRRPVKPDELSDDDCWEVIHQHAEGCNIGFDVALEVLERDMPSMAATTEALAQAIGAPWMRVDFFVGSSRWGVRLNEVAYGCGCDYRNRMPDGCVIDDAPAMASIIQEGYAQGPKSKSPESFLVPLGTQGSSYENMETSRVATPSPYGKRLSELFSLRNQAEINEKIVPEQMCHSVSHPPPAPFGRW